MAAQGFIVEFVGLPAAGKSHVATAVRASLADRLAAETDETPAVTTSSGKREDLPATVAAWFVASAVVRSPGRSLAATRALRTSGQRSATKTLRFALYHQYLRAELRRARQAGEIHLADQGILQHLRRVHLTASADGMGYLRTLAATCYPPLDPDLVVFVDVDHRTRMARATERGTDIDEELLDPDHPAIQDDLASYNDVKALVPELAEELDLAIRTMTIENRDDNLEANVERIVAAIREIRGDGSDEEVVSARFRALGTAQ